MKTHIIHSEILELETSSINMHLENMIIQNLLYPLISCTILVDIQSSLIDSPLYRYYNHEFIIKCNTKYKVQRALTADS